MILTWLVVILGTYQLNAAPTVVSDESIGFDAVLIPQEEIELNRSTIKPLTTLATPDNTLILEPLKNELISMFLLQPKLLTTTALLEQQQAQQIISAKTPKIFNHILQIKRGDNLSQIFSKLNLTSRDLFEIMQIGETTEPLKRLRPGQTLQLAITNNNQLQTLYYEIDLTNSIQVDYKDSQFTATLITHPLTKKIKVASAQINNSLFLAGKVAGLSDKIIMQLAEIYGWDIDFSLDIRAGDHFTVIYEENYKHGEKVNDGPILAATFNHRKKEYKTVRYTDEQGYSDYYSQTGYSMRKAFLRSPVDFRRISSHFNLQRKHPILNTMRAHKGVDYAAPHGTPIRATGEGKVSFIGKKGGYGNLIILQHGGKYSTVYAHLSKYKKGLKRGSLVKQGQTIGYVGSTGLATGPHLHYEFRVHGISYNPLTIKLPNADPIAQKKRHHFEKTTHHILRKLDHISQIAAQSRTTGENFEPTVIVLNEDQNITKISNNYPEN